MIETDTILDKLCIDKIKFHDWRERNIEQDTFLNQEDIFYWIHRFIKDLGEYLPWKDTTKPLESFSFFGLSMEKSMLLCSSVDNNVLLSQRPSYWLHEWVYQFQHEVDPKLLKFLLSFEDKEIKQYKFGNEDRSNTLDVQYVDNLSEDDTSLLMDLMESDRYNFGKDLYYHTTSIVGAQHILSNGIKLNESNLLQDFGGVTGGYYLNHTWDAAVNWINSRNKFNSAIIIYHIKESTMEEQ